MIERVGRERESQLLRDELAAVASDGLPRAIELSGAPGIGKSTIIDGLAAEAEDRGAAVWRLSPTEAERGLSWSALRGLVAAAQPFDSWPPAIEAFRSGDLAGFDHERLAYEFAGTVAEIAKRRLLVIVLDDAMWLDTASVPAITMAMRLVEHVLWVVAFRTDSPAPLDLARAMRGRDIKPLALEGLTFRETTALARQLSTWHWNEPELRRIQRITEGHPLFAAECIRAVTENAAAGDVLRLPRSLATLYDNRINALDARSRRLINVMALCHRPDMRTLAAATSMTEADVFAALEQPERDGLISVVKSTPTFRHALTRQAVLAAIGGAEQARLVTALAAVTPEPIARAEYLAACTFEPDSAVAEQLESAAILLRDVGAPERAAALFRRAAELTPTTSGEARIGERPALEADADRLRRLAAAVDSTVNAGNWQEGELITRSLIDEVTVDALPGVAVDRLICLHRLDGHRAAAAFAEQIIDRLESQDAPAWHLRFLRYRLLQFDDIRAAHRAAIRTRSILPPDANASLSLTVDAAIAQSTFLLGEPTDLTPLLNRVTSWSVGGGQDGVGYLSELLVHSHDFDRARAVFTGHLERGRAEGRVWMIFHGLDQLADVAYRSGDWDTAEALLTEVTSLVDPAGADQEALKNLELVCIRTVRSGTNPEFERLVPHILAEETNHLEPLMRLQQLAPLGLSCLATGRLGDAVTLLREAEALADRVGLLNPQALRFHGDLVEALVLRGEVAEAGAVAERLGNAARRSRLVWTQAEWNRVAGLVAAASGNNATARQHFDAAIECFATTVAPFHRARAVLDRASFLRRQKARAEARHGLEDAKERFEQLDARPWVLRCDLELARLGRGASAAELTASEQHMVDLACAGRSNRQIAAELIVSLRTVESTLTRVYRKLGVRSRTEMMALLVTSR